MAFSLLGNTDETIAIANLVPRLCPDRVEVPICVIVRECLMFCGY